jgi:hypothetical protein
MLSLEDPWTDAAEYRGSSVPSLIIRMDGVEEAQWVPVAATSAFLFIKLFFTGLTASTNYGQYIVRGKLQFRGFG